MTENKNVDELEEVVETSTQEIQESPVQNSEVSKEAEVDKHKPLKKSFLDLNMSYFFMFLTLILIIAITLLNNFFLIDSLYPKSREYINGSATIGLNLITFVVGCGIGTVFYNLGKFVGAKICKYKLQYFEAFGFRWQYLDGKYKFSFKITRFLDFHMRFTPENIESNPAPMLYMGFIFNGIFTIVLLAIGLALCLAVKTNESLAQLFGGGLVLSSLFSIIYPIYNIIPLRNDYDNDMFKLVKTANVEERKAYNLICFNEAALVNKKEIIAPDFENYNSYYKAQTLYYLYLDHLYHDELRKAALVLNQIQFYSKYIPEDMLYDVNGEKIYLLILNDQYDKANKLFLSLRKDNKRDLLDANNLPDYRIAMLVAGLLYHKESEVKDLIDEFNALTIDTSILSNRKELESFKDCVKMVLQMNPDFQLEEVKHD